MNTSVLSLSVIFLYLLSTFAFWKSAKTSNDRIKIIATLLLLTGWLIQGAVLHLQIDTSQGQNLSMSNLAGIISWIMLALLAISHFRSEVTLLMMIMLVVAILAQTLSQWFPSQRVFALATHPAAVAHILSILFAYSLLALAALQSLLVWWLDVKLKSHLGSSNPLIPPLLAMERLLYQMLLTGFIVFSLSILFAVVFLQDELLQQPIHKLVLSFTAWLLFGLLLLGHWRFGWRGQQAARWTLGAFFLLALGYFGVWAVKLWIL